MSFFVQTAIPWLRMKVESAFSELRPIPNATWRRTSAALHQLWNDSYALTVIALSVLATLLYQSSTSFWWGGSDHLDNLRIAWDILGAPGGMPAPRTPGMGLFLILTGVATLGTWKGLIVAYALMSILIPVFVYFTLSWLSRPVALTAAVLIICSAIPYQYSKTGAAEELFHFLHFLGLMLIARYFRNGSPVLLASIVAVLIALDLARPVAVLYFWLFTLIALAFSISGKYRVTHVVIAALVYASAMGAWALIERHAARTEFSPFLTFNDIPEKRLAEAYFDGPVHGFDQPRSGYAIDPAQGPASLELHDVLVSHITKMADQWQSSGDPNRPSQLFAGPSRHPVEMADTVLSTPLYCYFDLMREAAYAERGPNGGSQLIKQTAREHHTHGLWGAIRYLARHPIRLLVGGVPPAGNRNFFGLFLLTRYRYAVNQFYTVQFRAPPPGAADPLSRVDLVFEDNGPATRELMQGSRLFIDAFRWNWTEQNAWLAGYKDRPEDLYQAIFRTPEPGTQGWAEGFMYDSLVRLYGYKRVDRLYRQAAWETLHKYPFSAGIIWDNFLRATIVHPLGDIHSQWSTPPFSSWADGVQPVLTTDPGGLPPTLAAELPSEVRPGVIATFFGKAYDVFHLTSFLFLISAVLTLIPAFFTPARPLVVFLVAAYLYNIAVISVYGNFGAARYYDVFVFIPVILTAIGVTGALSLVRPRRRALSP